MISGLLEIWIPERRKLKIHVVKEQLALNSVRFTIENSIQASFRIQASIGKLVKQHAIMRLPVL